MLQALASTAGRLLADFRRAMRAPANGVPHRAPSSPLSLDKFQPLRRVTLTDEVGRTLFEEYAAHRKGARGDEETGWVLLGLRERDEAVALATLPAGSGCDASIAHVHFNSAAQALGGRIVRQLDRRLRMLGVVHTHPGSLRHPSDGDFRGDSIWVGQLRGGEGVFGIGTADHHFGNGSVYARQLKPHVQCMGDMCLSWYALRQGENHYRPLPYSLTLGPDLARPLHPVWSTIELHAEQLERLYLQQAGVTFEVGAGNHGPALSVNIPLAEPRDKVCVVLEGNDICYFVARGEELFRVNSTEERIDRGVYLLLAELAAKG
jgi:proteasome lid subunit RPN8/RPN11